MSVPVIAFFNNKGGVGKTTLVYHVAWMVKNLGYRVLTTDLDPQSNLSAAFLDEDRLEAHLRSPAPNASTIYSAIEPLKRGVGDILDPRLEIIRNSLALIPGDMALSQFEDELSERWPKCLDRDERAFRVMSAFWRVIQKGAEAHKAEVILVDLGPNLGAINRAALIASDFVVIPLGPDMFSLQGLQNLGPKLREWRTAWEDRLTKNPIEELDLPEGNMCPIGYIVMQHSVRRDRPVKAYEKWIARIPNYYLRYVLDKAETPNLLPPEDSKCFALLKHYRSLMPMAQESRKPIFSLKPADGALGAHTFAVQDSYDDFEKLARDILKRAQIGDPAKRVD